jgi:hypothetical protein
MIKVGWCVCLCFKTDLWQRKYISLILYGKSTD